LGKSIGLHAGLIWAYYILNVGQLIKYTGTVPDWLTGIDKNPLAGVMGLLFLTILAIWIRKKAVVSER
jgi:LPXTG-motif cell wall-anchored protein